MGSSEDELKKISEVFADKNAEMLKLLEERYKIQQELINEKKELREYIKTLEEKIFEKEKENEMELINLKERMSKIREEEVEELKQQIKNNEQSFQR